MTNLPLQFVASQLSNWEAPILHSLWRRLCCHRPACSREQQIDYILSALRQDEQVKSRDEIFDLSYRPFAHRWHGTNLSTEALLWAAAAVNLNQSLLDRYLDFCRQLPQLPDYAAPQVQSFWQLDCKLLPKLSYRIHYAAIYVAEYKYLSDITGWQQLTKTGDRQNMITALTRKDVEERLLQRVGNLGQKLGGDIMKDASISLYRDLIIPLTKSGEVDYLQQRAAAKI